MRPSLRREKVRRRTRSVIRASAPNLLLASAEYVCALAGMARRLQGVCGGSSAFLRDQYAHLRSRAARFGRLSSHAEDSHHTSGAVERQFSFAHSAFLRSDGECSTASPDKKSTAHRMSTEAARLRQRLRRSSMNVPGELLPAPENVPSFVVSKGCDVGSRQRSKSRTCLEGCPKSMLSRKDLRQRLKPQRHPSVEKNRKV